MTAIDIFSPVHKGVLLVLGVVGLGLAALWVAFWRDTGPGLPFLGLVLVALALTLAVRDWLSEKQVDRDSLRAFRLMADDPAACFITDAAGRLILRNQAAETRFGQDAHSMHEALGKLSLSPGELLQRLQKAAEASGAAREDLAGRGSVLRLTVHRADACQ